MHTSYQISQMSKLISVGIPSLDVVLRGLQRQYRWFCRCTLELKERRQTTGVRTAETLRSPGGRAHHPFCRYVRPNVSMTLRLSVINQKHVSATPRGFPEKCTILSNSPGEKNIRSQLKQMTSHSPAQHLHCDVLTTESQSLV